MENRYDDIIGLPHHRSQNRPPMPIENRAAQFAPFAALSGHDEAIEETARLTTSKIEITEEEKSEIARLLDFSLTRSLAVKISYFVKDQNKNGGEYNEVESTVSKIDSFDKIIILENGLQIDLDDILWVR